MTAIDTPADATTEHYTVISADTHAGGSHAAYREYLDEEFPTADDMRPL